MVSHRPDKLPLTRACQVLGLNRSTVYAHQKRVANDEPPQRSRQQSVQPRALSAEERTAIARTLHSAPYCDQPPAEVYQRLLEQGQYLCSVSTLHRMLRGLQEKGERRQQRPAQRHAVPRLKACTPHEVWTWDITKLPLIRRGIYRSLYVVLDLFSRFAVAFFGGIDDLAQGEQRPSNAPCQRSWQRN